MFNMDLRAFPTTTRYTTSRVRLGEHGGTLAPADIYMDRVRNINLGCTPGGRVFPGMVFEGNSQPFAGPVLFPGEVVPSNGDFMDHDGVGAGNVQPSNATHQGNVIWNTSNDNVVHPMDLGGIGPMGTNDQGHFQFNYQQANASVLGPSIDFDPYLGMMNEGGNNGATHFDVAVQHSIASRIDTNWDRAKQDDDDRGFRQFFKLDLDIPFYFNDPPTPDYPSDMYPGEIPEDPLGLMDENLNGESPATPELSHNPPTSNQVIQSWSSQLDDWFRNKASPPPSDSTLVIITDNIEDQEKRSQGQNTKVHVLSHPNPWKVLECMFFKNYSRPTETMSEGATRNVSVCIKDKWKRIEGMQRFKGRLRIGGTLDLYNHGSKKRKAKSGTEYLVEGSGANYGLDSRGQDFDQDESTPAKKLKGRKNGELMANQSNFNLGECSGMMPRQQLGSGLFTNGAAQGEPPAILPAILPEIRIDAKGLEQNGTIHNSREELMTDMEIEALAPVFVAEHELGTENIAVTSDMEVSDGFSGIVHKQFPKEP